MVFPGLTLGASLQQQIDDVGTQIDNKKKEEADKQDQIKALDVQLQEIVSQFQTAYAELARTQDDISKNQRQLNAAIERQSFYQEILNERSVFIYRNGQVFLIEVLLDTKNFTDFLVRLDFLSKISRRDAEILEASRNLKEEIETTREKLNEQKQRQNDLVNDLKFKQDEMNRILASQQQLLNSIQGDINNLAMDKEKLIQAKKEEEERLARLAAFNSPSNGDIADNVNGSNPSSNQLNMIFPVLRPYAHGYSNDWGAPRPGGSSHQGTDIFGSRGTPLVAVVDGVIGSPFGNSKLGGYRLWLNGDNGYRFYYAHLNGDEGVAFAPGIAPGVRVSQGQVIAYMGDSGQAKGTGVHLHFGITVNGQWINPYPYLKASDWR